MKFLLPFIIIANRLFSPHCNIYCTTLNGWLRHKGVVLTTAPLSKQSSYSKSTIRCSWFKVTNTILCRDQLAVKKDSSNFKSLSQSQVIELQVSLLSLEKILQLCKQFKAQELLELAVWLPLNGPSVMCHLMQKHLNLRSSILENKCDGHGRYTFDWG